ncbi:MAG TPA: hypothetical protein DGG94_09285 [Micromonosporaceae bacterium]|nr:hypothetical protein [Micromonosporaceae bacterium]HCU49975.1 hypothetical protein [Micromonosporaceae bacterium]
MRRHVLTDAQFRSLARGHGTPQALANLTNGQLTKRRLLVYQAARKAEAIGGGVARLAAEAMTLMMKAESQAPEAVREVLSHPHVDVWASRYIRVEGASDAPVSEKETCYLATLAATAGVRAGLSFAIALPATDGATALPGLGGITGLGRGPLLIQSNGSSLELSTSSERICVSAPYNEETRHWKPYRRLQFAEPGGSLTIAIEDLDQNRDCYPWQASLRLTSTQTQQLEQVCQQAWRLLVNDHRAYAEGIRAVFRALVPLHSPHNGGHVSATSRHSFGAIGLVPPADPAILAMLLIHESQHMKLGALMDLVDLHEPGGTARHHAPWRDDPRPIGALLQGTYAHLAVTDFWRVHRRAGHTDSHRPDFEFSYWRILTAAAIRTLVGSGELTERGHAFVGEIACSLGEWSAEPVPSDVDSAARHCAMLRASGWRLANWIADPALVKTLIQAWQARQPCPPVAQPHLANRPGRNGTRLAELVRVRWTGIEPDLSRTIADRAMLRGDHVSAAGHYARLIRLGEDHPAGHALDNWAGLAASLHALGRPGAIALAERPELVRAVHFGLRTAPGGPPEPDAIARWLEPAIADTRVATTD